MKEDWFLPQVLFEWASVYNAHFLGLKDAVKIVFFFSFIRLFQTKHGKYQTHSYALFCDVITSLLFFF